MSTAPPLTTTAPGTGATGVPDRAARFRAALNTRPAAYSLVLGVSAALLVGSARHSAAIILAGGVGVIAAVLAVCWLLAGRAPQRAEPPSLAERLGMHEAPGAERLHELTPLLSRGAHRRLDGVLAGPLAPGEEDGLQCVLARYAWWESQGDPPPPGGEPVPGEHRLTFCAVEVAHDAAGPDAELVAWLEQHPLCPGFELEGGSLVVFCDGWLQDADRLAWLRDAAARLAAGATAA